MQTDQDTSDESIYIKQLEKSVEILQNELEQLRATKKKSRTRATKSGQTDSFLAVIFASADSYRDVLLAYIQYIIKDVFAVETDIFLLDEHGKVNSISDNEILHFLPEFIKHSEESGIFGWTLENKTAITLPNFSSSNPYSYLLVPIIFRGKPLGFAASCFDPQKSKITSEMLEKLTAQSVYLASSISNILISKQLDALTSKLSVYKQNSTTDLIVHPITDISDAISKEIAIASKVISANIFMIENGVGEQEQRLETIKQHLATITKLNERLSNLNTANSTTTPEFLLSEVLEDLLLFSNSQLQSDGITIKTLFEEIPQPMAGDKILFEQAILYIIMFAKSRMPDGGVLNITLCKIHDNKVNLTLTDTSIGLTEAESDSIFEQYLSTTSDSSKFGLARPQRIFNEMNCKFEVISELGSGITYKIIIPLTD